MKIAKSLAEGVLIFHSLKITADCFEAPGVYAVAKRMDVLNNYFTEKIASWLLQTK